MPPTYLKPTTMNLIQFKKDLSLLEDAFTAKMNDKANVIKKKIVIPFCDKHELNFICGMGTWFFVTKTDEKIDDSFHCSEEDYVEYGITKETLSDLKEVVAFLKSNVFSNNYIYFHMSDYKRA